MKSNKKSALIKHLKGIPQELREIGHFIKRDKVIIRNLSFRLLLSMMAVFLMVNVYTQHKKVVMEEENLKSLAEILNNPELSDESIELVKTSVKEL